MLLENFRKRNLFAAAIKKSTKESRKKNCQNNNNKDESSQNSINNTKLFDYSLECNKLYMKPQPNSTCVGSVAVSGADLAHAAMYVAQTAKALRRTCPKH